MSGEYDLILHVRIPGWHADDLLGLLAEFEDSKVIDIISEEFRSEVGIVVCSDAGEMSAHDGLIVDADVVAVDDVWSEHRLNRDRTASRLGLQELPAVREEDTRDVVRFARRVEEIVQVATSNVALLSAEIDRRAAGGGVRD